MMPPTPPENPDWSDFKRRKRQAIQATFIPPIPIFIIVILLLDTKVLPFVGIPLFIAWIIASIVFQRRLQTVNCPICGQAFMDQDDNLIISRTAGWRVLFNTQCHSCGGHHI